MKDELFYASATLYDEVKNMVLLHKRDDKTDVNPNMWSFFGGLSEPGETPLQTVAREIKEELNISIKPEEFEPLTDYFNEEMGRHRYVFFVRSNLPKSAMKLGEGADFYWVALDKVFEYELTEKNRKDLKIFIEKIAKK